MHQILSCCRFECLDHSHLPDTEGASSNSTPGSGSVLAQEGITEDLVQSGVINGALAWIVIGLSLGLLLLLFGYMVFGNPLKLLSPKSSPAGSTTLYAPSPASSSILYAPSPAGSTTLCAPPLSGSTTIYVPVSSEASEKVMDHTEVGDGETLSLLTVPPDVREKASGNTHVGDVEEGRGNTPVGDAEELDPHRTPEVGFIGKRYTFVDSNEVEHSFVTAWGEHGTTLLNAFETSFYREVRDPSFEEVHEKKSDLAVHMQSTDFCLQFCQAHNMDQDECIRELSSREIDSGKLWLGGFGKMYRRAVRVFARDKKGSLVAVQSNGDPSCHNNDFVNILYLGNDRYAGLLPSDV
eukprot:GHVQ01041879.1.p1 GENE.GHVQ01041879.1~~GHVQ01041879.1.p1  ORF type:complete len:352 (-),score=33.41 GHVQ01041879.1:423-1478(-)